MGWGDAVQATALKRQMAVSDDFRNPFVLALTLSGQFDESVAEVWAINWPF